MLFFLGAILPISYIPFYTGQYILTGFIVLSCVLPFFFLRPIEMGAGHWLGLTFIAYAYASLCWVEVPQQAVWDLWETVILAGCFMLGASRDTRWLFIGMAFGIFANTIIAINQYFVHDLSLVFRVNPYALTGLFINPDMFGETACLVMIMLLSLREWWAIPVLAPAILMSGSRASLVALTACVVLWAWDRWRWKGLLLGAILAVAPAYYVTGFHRAAITEREALWLDTIQGTTNPFGHGAGSFFATYPKYAQRTDTMSTRPEDPHNEFLNLAFEYGVGALPILGLLAMGIAAGGPARYPLLAFLVIALFSFPSRIPTEAIVGMVALGTLCGTRPWPWPFWRGRRPLSTAWQVLTRRGSVSVEPVYSHKTWI